MDDTSSDGHIDEGSDEHAATRSHFFTRTLGDGWLEVEPGIYLQRGEVDELKHVRDEEDSLDDALSDALQPANADPEDDHDEAGRLRRWLHR